MSRGVRFLFYHNKEEITYEKLMEENSGIRACIHSCGGSAYTGRKRRTFRRLGYYGEGGTAQRV